jgi:hypothetical protein
VNTDTHDDSVHDHTSTRAREYKARVVHVCMPMGAITGSKELSVESIRKRKHARQQLIAHCAEDPNTDKREREREWREREEDRGIAPGGK